MKFVFGIHNHQPVGNFDHVFEAAYQDAYKPFIDIVEKYSFLHFSLHVSGPLIEWLEKHHPDYFDRVAKMVGASRVEILSSGFYEPILASIPDDDKIGQIRMMNDYIHRRFGVVPEGLWLTERVWEPGLVKPIVEAGIKYIAVDDTHFATSGIDSKNLKGYFLTEDQGYVLGVFPISQKLRYTMPFRPPGETIEIFKNHQSNPDDVMVMADDGEKFGVWPGTKDLCYGEGNWLDRFLSLLEKNQDIVETRTFSHIFHFLPPGGRVYLPTSSYFEMGEWTLATGLYKELHEYLRTLEESDDLEKRKPFIKGGFWRNFLTKYDESNWMLKRVNGASMEMGSRFPQEVRNEIWKSQCNCGFWHGVFGGLYLPHLRHAIYSHLLAAESQMNYPPVRNTDIDHDGYDEVILKSDSLQVFLSLKGGAIRELDHFPSRFNLVNGLSRYHEAYHEKLLETTNSSGEEETVSIHDIARTKEEGLENLLFYDKHPRWMFMDHFLPIGTELETLYRSEEEELFNFINAVFHVSMDGEEVVFRRAEKAGNTCVVLEKTVLLDEDELILKIRIINDGYYPLKCLYGTEFNFSLLGGHAHDRYYLFDGEKPEDHYLDSKGVSRNRSVSLVTEWEKIKCQLEAEDKIEFWRFPIETISMSESGFERIYQSSAVIPVHRLDLQPGEEFITTYRIRIELID